MEASKARRFVNWLVDLFCILFLFLAALRLLPAGALHREHYRYALAGITFAYYAGAEFFFRRTVGKLLTSTRLISAADEPLSGRQVLLRTLCRFIPLEPVSLLISRRQRAWHDQLSHTKVVHLN